MINLPLTQTFNNNQYFNMMINQSSKMQSPPSTSTAAAQQQQHHTPIKGTTIKQNIIQSPLQISSFKLGSIAITHQSSPYINNKLILPQKNDDEECDEEKPKIFQVEDSVTTTVATTVAALSSLTSKCDSLNISSPSNSAANCDTSFLSCQTKSSLKSSSISTNNSNKHVKFFTENKKQNQPPPETPIMFSRCSSMTSLNSFDTKSIHSSVASEYSRRPSGLMSPSELPDSPDESLRLAQSQLQDSKSNEITIIERTVLSNKLNNNGSSNNSEKNSFYNNDGITYLKDSTVAYDCEGSPWRTHAHSEVSSLSALTFNDDLNDNKVASNKDIAAILSLLQTRTKEKQQQQQQQYQQMLNFNTLSFTPPIKLPASTSKSISNKSDQQQQSDFYYSNNSLQKQPAAHEPSLPLSIEIPKLYCDENTPSNISPQSAMSELSVPSLIKQETSQTQFQKSQFNNFDALFKRMSFNANNNVNNNKQKDDLEVVDLDEVPKVYKTEDNHNANEPKQPAAAVYLYQQQLSHDTDSPKVFLTEDTPMCYSRSSSLNSLNNDATNRTAININTNKSNSDDKLNKSTSILLSDSCNKPTNTPAFVNMSRASYASQNDTEDDDDDENEFDDKENKEGDDYSESDEEEDSSKEKENENILINQFINQTMPVTVNRFKSKNKSTNNSPHMGVKITNKSLNKENNINNDNDDEILLQNFIKEMLPPVPTRKSISRLPILKKTENLISTKPPPPVNVQTALQNKCKKRLSEENPGVHSSKVQQHNRNFSMCYNLTNSQELQQQQLQQQMAPQSPKCIKKVPNLTLLKTSSQLNATNLNKSTLRKVVGSTNLAQTSSTYSLSTLTTTTTNSSSSNSVTANSQHHPIVNMTRTTQLRASRVAETKSSELRKLNASTQRNSIGTVVNKQKQTTKPITNIPKATTNQQVETARRKSFQGIGLGQSKKSSTTTSNRCTNENQLLSINNAESSKNILKKTNLNKFNK